RAPGEHDPAREYEDPMRGVAQVAGADGEGHASSRIRARADLPGGRIPEVWVRRLKCAYREVGTRGEVEDDVHAAQRRAVQVAHDDRERHVTVRARREALGNGGIVGVGNAGHRGAGMSED